MVSKNILDIASRIPGRKYQGSSLCCGMLYHDIPIGEYKNMKSHRKNTMARWNKISEYVDFKDKTVIDLGCSVGSFSLLVAQAGAKLVTGYDYDKESIDMAIAVADDLEIKNIDFVNKKIDIGFFKALKNVDITIWMSNWMWLYKQYGFEIAAEMLTIMSKKSKIMVFETASNDGMARIKNTTQEDIKKWLHEYTCYKKIIDVGAVAGWNNRNIFICQ